MARSATLAPSLPHWNSPARRGDHLSRTFFCRPGTALSGRYQAPWAAGRRIRATARQRQPTRGVPTVLRAEGLRFFFYSNEGHEAPHVHVEHAEGCAKFWLWPLRLAFSAGLRPGTLKCAKLIVFEHQRELRDKSREHFGT